MSCCLLRFSKITALMILSAVYFIQLNSIFWPKECIFILKISIAKAGVLWPPFFLFGLNIQEQKFWKSFHLDSFWKSISFQLPSFSKGNWTNSIMLGIWLWAILLANRNMWFLHLAILSFFLLLWSFMTLYCTVTSI